MAEVGEIIESGNLLQTDTSEWKYESYRIYESEIYIDEMIYVGGSNKGQDFSISVEIKNLKEYQYTPGLRIGFELYDFNGYKRGTLNNLSEEMKAPLDGPLTVNFTTNTILWDIEYIKVFFRKISRGPMSFEYRHAVVTKGPPQPWTDGSTDDGLIDLDNRFSPRIKANGMGVYPLHQYQVMDFFYDLWNKNFMETFFEKVSGDPANSIMSLRYFYGIKGNIKRSKSDTYVQLGNVKFDGVINDKEIITKPAISEFVNFDAGEMLVTREFNNFLDYSPYTNVEVYIPFYGFHALNANEVMGNNIKLEYSINIVTGASLANLYVRAPSGARYRLLTSLTCDIGVDIPVNFESMDSLGNRLAQRAIGTANQVASIGMAAAMPMMGAMNAAPNIIGGSRQFLPDNISTEKGGYGKAIAGAEAKHSAISESMMYTAFDQIETPQFTPDSSSRSSGMSGEVGSMSDFEPALYITRPQIKAPDNYNEMVGMPDYSSGVVSDYSGYIKVGAFDDGNYNIPRQAMNEVVQILKGGVYVD